MLLQCTYNGSLKGKWTNYAALLKHLDELPCKINVIYAVQFQSVYLHFMQKKKKKKKSLFVLTAHKVLEV